MGMKVIRTFGPNNSKPLIKSKTQIIAEYYSSIMHEIQLTEKFLFEQMNFFHSCYSNCATGSNKLV